MELEMYSDPAERRRFIRGLVRKELHIAKDLLYILLNELSRDDVKDVMGWPLLDPKEAMYDNG